VLKRFARLVLALALAFNAFASPASAGGDHWPIDRRHSRVSFAVTKWGFAEVEGRFLDFSGVIAYNATRPEASHIEWTVRIATVDTGEVKRDQALQDAEYFDAAHYPLMQFVSERVQRSGANELDVAGTLTIKGVSKPLTVRVTYGGRHTVPSEGTFDTFKTSFTINRYDFGIVGGRVLGPAISTDVKVTLIAAARQPAR
jgi:polyisoprenoid-binding protein YceI